MSPQKHRTEDETTAATRTGNPNHHRKKAAVGVRTWLSVSSTGEASVSETGKQTIMRRTGLPARDLRILDPVLSYPSTVLGRERAIVINLEHVKAIITANEVLLHNFKDPAVVPFVEELQRRISRHHNATVSQEGVVNANDTDWKSFYDLGEPQSRAPDRSTSSRSFKASGEEGEATGRHVHDKQDGLKLLPFEFIALEACLEAACGSLEKEARTLEQEAHPALDKLTSKISTLNLERVRQIKSRLVAITGRVQKARDELEHLLDDDEDMAEMYLTEKLMQLEYSSASSMDRQQYSEDDEVDNRIPDDGSSQSDDAINEGETQRNDSQCEKFLGIAKSLSRGSRATRSSTTHSSLNKQLDVQELEMLLEAYFIQIDGTLNKLSTLREYVDDTEDYINIMLDDKQNHLLQMGVMLTTATLVVSAFVVVAGVFGMNIHIELFISETDEQKIEGNKRFWWTVAGSTAGTIFLYISAIAWCKYKKLIQ